MVTNYYVTGGTNSTVYTDATTNGNSYSPTQVAQISDIFNQYVAQQAAAVLQQQFQTNAVQTTYIRPSNTGTVINTSSPNINQLRDYKVQHGHAITLTLPDGSIIDVKADGSHTITDSLGKITYRGSRTREFNPFINASDKLEDFIKYCGGVGVRQSEVLRLPLELFVAWLVIEAARADREPEPDVQLLPNLQREVKPRCTGCGRFINRLLRLKHIEYCAPACFDSYYHRVICE